jgi:hypothetical protein
VRHLNNQYVESLLIARREKYFLAAADQPSGPRASRLAQVIKAKYDAGLLKPYDYVKGYERIARWMDSGRAAPKADSLAGSVPNSPQKGANKNGRMAMTCEQLSCRVSRRAEC